MSAPMHVRLVIVLAFGVFFVALNAVLSMMPPQDRPGEARSFHPNVGARR